LVCVTNNPVKPARKTLEVIGISDFFEHIVGLDTCYKSKPAIEPFEKALELTNSDAQNCIAIGDHINDLDMFNSVGYKIAMDNACNELKEQANFITKSNDDDGVKYALEYLEKEVYKI
jgi:phosphoglycolate phosphatase-like HAD superfamily hydrolase